MHILCVCVRVRARVVNILYLRAYVNTQFAMTVRGINYTENFRLVFIDLMLNGGRRLKTT